MSRICGIIETAGGARSARRLGAVMDYMTPAGAGQGACWDGKPVALGSVPLSNGGTGRPTGLWRHEPSGRVITADLRLDNRCELSRALGYGEKEPEIVEDHELVLAAYLEWGRECVRKLLGDYAFAIWDPEEDQLFCARDPMAGRHFYYVENAHLFAFSSDPESLLLLPGVSVAPNEERIESLLVPGLSKPFDRRSWQKDVLALMPGERLTVARGGRVHLETFYELEAYSHPRYSSDEEFLESFTDRFDEAVACRWRPAPRPGLMMSGGLDSAAIVNSLLTGSSGAVATYSVVADDTEADIESRSIRELAELPCVHSHCIEAPLPRDRIGFTALQNFALDQAHPVDNSVLLPALVLMTASRDGIDTMVHGAAGDVAMAAPRFYPAELLRSFKWARAWHESGCAGSNNAYLQGRSRWDVLLRSAYRAFTPSALRGRVWRSRNGFLRDASFVASEELLERSRIRSARLAPPDPDDPVMVADLLLSGNAGFGRVAARFGIQAADPWADRRIQEFFFGLPVGYKVRDGWNKYPVRATLARQIPQSVRRRKDKQHLGWRLEVGFLTASIERIGEIMNQDLGSMEAFVNIKRARWVFDEFQRGRAREQAHDLLMLISLILWLKRVDSLSSQQTE